LQVKTSFLQIPYHNGWIQSGQTQAKEKIGNILAYREQAFAICSRSSTSAAIIFICSLSILWIGI
jgi:hypothetical protein